MWQFNPGLQKKKNSPTTFDKYRYLEFIQGTQDFTPGTIVHTLF